MKITNDLEADAMYVELTDAEAADSLDLEDGVTADVDAEGHIIAIEVRTRRNGWAIHWSRSLLSGWRERSRRRRGAGRMADLTAPRASSRKPQTPAEKRALARLYHATGVWFRWGPQMPQSVHRLTPRKPGVSGHACQEAKPTCSTSTQPARASADQTP